VQNIPKSLIVISDMLEFTPDYNQYPPADLSYARFRRSPAYPKYALWRRCLGDGVRTRRYLPPFNNQIVLVVGNG